jgi:hypothetical protein
MKLRKSLQKTPVKRYTFYTWWRALVDMRDGMGSTAFYVWLNAQHNVTILPSAWINTCELSIVKGAS